MSLIRYIFSKYFWSNLALALIIFFIGCLIVVKLLSIYTHHGQFVVVPDLRGMTFDQAKEELNKRDLRYFIMDSSYVEDKAPGEVLLHIPGPNDKVKKNRTIYISINMSHAPMIKMPMLIDNSLKNAQNILRLKGLKMGKPIIKPNKYNYVVDQYYKGKHIEPGAEIAQGATIVPVVGSGTGDEKFPAPDIRGLSIVDAENVLREYSLEIFTMGYQPGVTDSANAVIVHQTPSPGSAHLVTFGDVIEVLLGDPSQIQTMPEDNDSTIKQP